MTEKEQTSLIITLLYVIIYKLQLKYSLKEKLFGNSLKKKCCIFAVS